MEAVEASQKQPGILEECSLLAGWSSLLLRRYREPLSVDPFETARTQAQLIVLVKSGSTKIESFAAGRWRQAHYVPGDLGMTPAGETAQLRWQGSRQHTTLHLHLPRAVLVQACEALRVEAGTTTEIMRALSARDPLVSSVMLALESGAEAGLPNLYAESAAYHLALHILAPGNVCFRGDGADRRVLNRLDEILHESLAHPVLLSEVARLLDRSPFQVIRMTKRVWGQTPYQRLTSLRMQHARGLLEQPHHTTAAIAVACGYTNTAHFALAFRRAVGMSPAVYRKTHARYGADLL